MNPVGTPIPLLTLVAAILLTVVPMRFCEQQRPQRSCST